MTENGLTFAPQMSSLVSKNSECALTYTGSEILLSTKTHEDKVDKGQNKKRKSRRKSQKLARKNNRKC